MRGTTYRLQWPYDLPSHNSKTVLSVVKIGPPREPRGPACVGILGGVPQCDALLLPVNGQLLLGDRHPCLPGLAPDCRRDLPVLSRQREDLGVPVPAVVVHLPNDDAATPAPIRDDRAALLSSISKTACLGVRPRAASISS